MRYMIEFMNVLMLTLSWKANGTKIFSFHDVTNNNATGSVGISSATATNMPEEHVPDRFTICSTHKQQQIETSNTATIYVLYWDSNFSQPWFSMGFFGQYKLWANINYKNWYALGQAKPETFLTWIHICVEVDTVNATLHASINGGNVTSVHNVKGLTPKPRLYLRLGMVDESYYAELVQYVGSVGNINIYNMEDNADEKFVALAAQNTCKIMQMPMPNFLVWSYIKWSIVGTEYGVEEKDVENDILCSKSKSLNFKIPLLWNKIEATEECHKYGKAKISIPPIYDLKNVSDQYLENIYGTSLEQCKYFWTPFNDEHSEGTFINERTNETLRYCLNLQ